MVRQFVKESPHQSFRVSRIGNSIAICEANSDDRFNWGNATEDEPAFLVYLGCKKTEVAGYMKTFNLFYRCDWCETRKPKYLKDYEVEIKIRGMQRKSDSHAYGLDRLLRSEAKKNPTDFAIDLGYCIDDMVDNFVYERREYEELPNSMLREVVFDAINEFIEKFSTNPEKYVSDRVYAELDKAVAENLPF